ncbi:PHD and RING finger domain-containing 1 [Melia azedarach]|uniref:PHD and RING finger domain-containing 1 n=2 Tax=Melia azedarach TaxID=155640 RepID=A0ACC1Y8H6_MELAZ|nr:PHD and RING finger domain-containing 1 [Melia azedarach]KAJ4719375.1 PHD and RING finger domain-containing 1 [Melia azedarach]
MGRGGKVGSKQDFKKRARSKDKCSDDSDEDYVVSDEEDEVSEDDLEDYCSSVDGGSEESFDCLVEEDEEEEEEEEEEIDVRKVVRSKARKSNLGNGKYGVKTSRKRKRLTYGDEEDEDEDYEEEDEDEDEEFTPDEDDCLHEEEELVVTKKRNNNNNKKKKKKKKRKNTSNLGRKGLRKKGSVTGGSRSKSTVSKKPLGNKGRRNRGLRKKERRDEVDDDDVEFIDDRVVMREKSKTNLSRRKRRYVVPSDSDFASSGSSDYEYTISEEEREQVREANELFGSLKTSLRNSSSSKGIEEDGNVSLQRKPPRRKGKEKIEEVKSEVVKQVCGICLSEEDKRRLRGTLNCCSHYFCFTCIMEWSKVESRCPLCKQRFKTITKPERSTAGVDLRSVVIPVPERDQVYQPSEEDLRSYLDPYENVICSECHQGGDDGLMLLCDICDSSAHTYCVGLGRVVPEGNWYCDGCRPVALGSSSSQALDPLADQRTMSTNLYNRPSPVVSFGEGLDSFSVSSPRVTLTQGSGNLTSPRFPVGDVQAASPGSGAGAPTLSGRRWIHRHIQNLLSINRMNIMAGSVDGTPTANLSSELLNSQVDQGRETVVQPARAQETEPLHPTILEERLHEHPSSTVENRDLFASRLTHLRRQAVQGPIATANGSVNLTLWPELAGINSIPSYDQLHQCNSISNIGVDMHSLMAKDEGDFYVEKEQLQSIVKNHLKNLSTDIELDQSTFKDIASSSTHTILAACGLEHRSEVHIVHPPSTCSHVERVAGGQTSLMKGQCSSCFDSFVRDVVKRIMDTRLPQWLSLGL